MSEKPQQASLFYERYKIESEIGRGASGVCYKIRRIQDGKTFALKKISSSSLKKNNLKGAYNEVSILSSLKHPHIIRYHESFVGESDLYIVMQYASKGDLHSILKKRKIKQHFYEEQEIWKIILQLLRALDYLHGKSIIHRDVKTLNIFVEENNAVFIGDLGVSKIIKADLGLYSRVGTPLYLAPEIIKYEKYDFKADIWGLGCVSYLITALNHPFEGKNIISLGQNIVNTEPKRLERYSDRLNQIIFEMLEKNHLKRHSTSHLLQKYFPDNKSPAISKKKEASCDRVVQVQGFQEEGTESKKSTAAEVKRENDFQGNLNPARYSVCSNLSTENKITYKSTKMALQGRRHQLQHNKVPGFVGNFVNERFKPPHQISKNSLISDQSNKNFETTIVLKANKVVKEKEEQQQIDNEELTKPQNSKNVFEVKKQFLSEHNLQSNPNKIVPTKVDSFLFEKPRNQPAAHRQKSGMVQGQGPRRSLIKQSQLLSSSTHCLIPSQDRAIDSQVAAKLMNHHRTSSRQQTEIPNGCKSPKNNELIRKIPTEAPHEFFHSVEKEKQTHKKFNKQYSMPGEHDRGAFTRSVQQRPSSGNCDTIYRDVFKMANESSLLGDSHPNGQNLGRYRQRPKSSIGKKQRMVESSAIRSRKREFASMNFMPTAIETKTLGKPEVVIIS